MSEIVTVRPRENSRKFQVDRGMHQMHTVSDDGGATTKDKSLGEYKGQKFPKSRQMFRPKWSQSQRKWVLDGFDTNSKALNTLVRKCNLKYQDDHPKRREYIATADILDFNDPFFTHKMCKVMAEEGVFLLRKETALDSIMLAAMKKDVEFQVAGENAGILSSRVKYIIVDKDKDQAIRRKIRENKMKVVKLYEGLSDAKKSKIAITMGLVPNNDVDRSIIDDLLWKASEDRKNKIDGLSRQQLFIDLCEMNTEKLSFKHTVRLAKSAGFLKKNNSGWLLFGHGAGRTLKDVEDFLSDPDRQDLLVRLQTALDDKSK